MSNRFHNKWHRHNHHTYPAVNEPDSSHDPIASPSDPFKGDFVIEGAITQSAPTSTYGGVFQSKTALSALGTTTGLYASGTTYGIHAVGLSKDSGDIKVGTFGNDVRFPVISAPAIYVDGSVNVKYALTAQSLWTSQLYAASSFVEVTDMHLSETSGFIVKGPLTGVPLTIPASYEVSSYPAVTLSGVPISGNSWASFAGDIKTSNNAYIANNLTATNIFASSQVTANSGIFNYLDINVSESGGLHIIGSSTALEVPCQTPLPDNNALILSGVGLSANCWASFSGDVATRKIFSTARQGGLNSDGSLMNCRYNTQFLDSYYITSIDTGFDKSYINLNWGSSNYGGSATPIALVAANYAAEGTTSKLSALSAGYNDAGTIIVGNYANTSNVSGMNLYFGPQSLVRSYKWYSLANKWNFGFGGVLMHLYGPNGNLGINVGDEIPQAKLTVNGNISASGNITTTSTMSVSDILFGCCERPDFVGMKQALESLLYVSPLVVSHGIRVNGSGGSYLTTQDLEVGQTLTSIQAMWSHNKIKDEAIVYQNFTGPGNINITYNNGSRPKTTSVTTLSPTQSFTNSTGSHTYTITLRDCYHGGTLPIGATGNGQVSTNMIVNWKYKFYFGAIIDPNTLTTPSNILANDQHAIFGTSKSDLGVRSINCSGNEPAGKYWYIAYPSGWGTLTNVSVNGFPFTDYSSLGTVTLTNDSGGTGTYIIYKSNVPTNGTITVGAS